MWWSNILRCPVCGAGTQKEENSLCCLGARRHTFDFAAQGYVNLADPKAAGGGDDAGLIAARTAFLSAGYYEPFAARIETLLQTYLPSGGVVVDAGCGEGYYTRRIAKAGFSVLGFDLSKRGIKSAASAAKREGLGALFAVAGIFTLPIKDASVDAVVSLFAPMAEREFLRVLKPGGVFITAGAGAEHLLSLKRVLYEIPRKNEPRADLPVSMTLCESETLHFTMQLDGQGVADLFAMTPYYYRTPKEGHARFAALTGLSCEAEMDIAVYRKQ